MTVKEIVRCTDPRAFVIVSDVREVLGRGDLWNIDSKITGCGTVFHDRENFFRSLYNLTKKRGSNLSNRPITFCGGTFV